MTGPLPGAPVDGVGQRIEVGDELVKRFRVLESSLSRLVVHPLAAEGSEMGSPHQVVAPASYLKVPSPGPRYFGDVVSRGLQETIATWSEGIRGIALQLEVPGSDRRPLLELLEAIKVRVGSILKSALGNGAALNQVAQSQADLRESLNTMGTVIGIADAHEYAPDRLATDIIGWLRAFTARYSHWRSDNTYNATLAFERRNVIDAIAQALEIEAYQNLDHNDLGAAILKGIGALQADEKHMEECAVLFDGVLGEIGEELGVDCREEADDPEFHAELLAAVRDLKTADRAVGAIHSLAAALGMEGLEGDGPAVICGKILARADQLKARVDLAAKGGVSLQAVQMTEALLADQLEAIAFLRHEHQVVSRLAQELKSGLLDVAEAAGFADPDRYTIADLVARIKGALSKATP